MYILKLALRPWRVAPLSQFLGAISVGFLLFSCSFLFWLERGLDPVLNRLKSEQILTAFLVPTVSVQEEKTILDSIHHLVGSSTVEFTSAAEFMKDLKQIDPELASSLLDLGTGGLNAGNSSESFLALQTLIPRYFTISGVISLSEKEKLKQIPGIETLDTTENRYRYVIGAFTALQWFTRIVAFGIALALITGLIHQAKTHNIFHQKTYSVLELWGASSYQSKLPCLVSGTSVGLIGGVFAAVMWLLMVNFFHEKILVLSPLFESLPVANRWYSLGIICLGALGGFFAGFLGKNLRVNV